MALTSILILRYHDSLAFTRIHAHPKRQFIDSYSSFQQGFLWNLLAKSGKAEIFSDEREVYSSPLLNNRGSMLCYISMCTVLNSSLFFSSLSGFSPILFWQLKWKPLEVVL